MQKGRVARDGQQLAARETITQRSSSRQPSSPTQCGCDGVPPERLQNLRGARSKNIVATPQCHIERKGLLHFHYTKATQYPHNKPRLTTTRPSCTPWTEPIRAKRPACSPRLGSALSRHPLHRSTPAPASCLGCS